MTDNWHVGDELHLKGVPFFLRVKRGNRFDGDMKIVMVPEPGTGWRPGLPDPEYPLEMWLTFLLASFYAQNEHYNPKYRKPTRQAALDLLISGMRKAVDAGWEAACRFTKVGLPARRS